jgi:hypothetical protein
MVAVYSQAAVPHYIAGFANMLASRDIRVGTHVSASPRSRTRMRDKLGRADVNTPQSMHIRSITNRTRTRCGYYMCNVCV